MDVAEKALRHVIEVAAAQHDPYLEATAMGNLGYLSSNTFHFEEAIYWFDKARVLFQQLGSDGLRITSRWEIWARAICVWATPTKALANLEEAEDHAREIGDRFREQLWIGNSGEALYDRGDLQKGRGEIQAGAGDREVARQGREGFDRLVVLQSGLHCRLISAITTQRRSTTRRRCACGRLSADHSDFYPRVNEAHIAAGRKDPRAEELYRGLIAEYHEGMNPVPMLEAQAGLADAARGKRGIRSGRRAVPRARSRIWRAGARLLRAPTIA